MGSSNGIGTSELIELLVSFIVLTIAFSMMGIHPGSALDPFSAKNLLIVGIAAGMGFMLHELAHKFVAQRYGYIAEYKASIWGLGLTMIMALTHFPIVFAAPGAVVIRKSAYSSPQSSYEYNENDDQYWDNLESKMGTEDLWISLAGPITNIILTALFFALIMSRVLTNNLYFDIALTAFRVNLMLAAFNLIPLNPLDGYKIFRSNPLLWALVAVPTILIALTVFLLGIYPF